MAHKFAYSDVHQKSPTPLCWIGSYISLISLGSTSLDQEVSFAKETYNFIDPTDKSKRSRDLCMYLCIKEIDLLISLYIHRSLDLLISLIYIHTYIFLDLFDLLIKSSMYVYTSISLDLDLDL